MAKPMQKSNSKNIQITDLIKTMAVSEPCLFNNSTVNLMPVTIFKDNVTYKQWCKIIGYDPKDSESEIAWSEMRNNR